MGSSSWFRYMDNVLVIVPERTNIDNKLRMLNEVDIHIEFTVEVNNMLPFLVMLIQHVGSEAKFSVYRKPMNKNDYTCYLSNHDWRTKLRVLIGFLRAYRIYGEE